jgi:hypothetical protein
MAVFPPTAGADGAGDEDGAAAIDEVVEGSVVEADGGAAAADRQEGKGKQEDGRLLRESRASPMPPQDLERV